MKERPDLMASHNPFRHTDADTLSMLMPAAEIAIMRMLWTNGPLQLKTLHEHINAERQLAGERPLAYTTVKTTADRLVRKGLLRREKPAHGYSGIYVAMIAECDFVLRIVHQMLDCVARDYPSALTSYLDTRHEVTAG